MGGAAINALLHKPNSVFEEYECTFWHRHGHEQDLRERHRFDSLRV